MKILIRFLKIVFFLMISLKATGQEDDRVLLRGKVMYRGSNVIDENVINATAKRATITDDNGEFVIPVKQGDELVFSAVNYQFKVVEVTREILKKNRLVVEVKEKITQLDEVVVGPENREKFLQEKSNEFKQFVYEQDRLTPVENDAISVQERGMEHGLNVINIFKAIFKSNDNNQSTESKLKLSQALRKVYDDDFFVIDLRIPEERINEFLFYCDQRVGARKLLKKENEFALIDFLVKTSNDFLKER